MPWLQLKLTTTRQQAGTLEDALLSVGAVSVTLEDDADQPILEPALGETPLWDRVRVTGLFDANIDTAAVSAELGSHRDDWRPDHRGEALEDHNGDPEWLG